MIASYTLRNSRIGNTYAYAMYSGAAVTGEEFVTGTTTYPYIFESATNGFVVKMLNAYLASINKTLAEVGGSLHTCMGSEGRDATGQTCYKALLAAAAPADCPAANVLCCPLFWRVRGQNIETTMAEMDAETIFWNGAHAINGFFTNFSQSYLMENGNCSKPVFSDTTAISLSVDATGEWRFVPLLTSYVLQETALNINATSAATYFNNTNPQDTVDTARVAQQPLYRSLQQYVIPVVVCVALLVVTGLFLVIACGCQTHRTNDSVHRIQQRLIELKSVPPPQGSVAILNAISPESSSRDSSSSSSGNSPRSKQQTLNRSMSRHSAVADRSGNDSLSSGRSDPRDAAGSGESAPLKKDKKASAKRLS
ncbi:hypothetical protein ABB37_07129 [Leptomonas pyrrhocoris]|uniref:Uncharacterized protein n=1 Tax=Leptomonas pyrrhocoris TaxID=157538 RepID=A0A0N0DTC3_LEPPY|nr:hypothetical protein ABB37_07129 [Leptomonas pyrrhocoris]KPA77222.1 hypothetical protein ABB37_07129 [Leptomonas pyrrhocoris]|eukprot:XP_015655661.1 hypothetical protein ABB37_07129 [Leptomonas pyrrhocoris]